MNHSDTSKLPSEDLETERLRLNRRQFMAHAVAFMSLTMVGCRDLIEITSPDGASADGSNSLNSGSSGCRIADSISPDIEARTSFLHPGLLNTAADFERMRQKIDEGAEPWASGWAALTSSYAYSLSQPLRPTEEVTRPGNVASMIIDMQQTYAYALVWKITGDTRYGDKAVEYLDAWSSTMTSLTGNADRFLASGLYGCQWACAGEIMRTYDGWSPEGLARFQGMLSDIFLPMCRQFLREHNGTEWTKITNYWANWDLANMCGMLAIGVFCDDAEAYNEAIEYFTSGRGNGAIDHAVQFVHPGHLGQWQESARDQGHTTLGIALIGCFCEMAWNQGDDLYSHRNNRVLAAAEYVAAMNHRLPSGEFPELPFAPFRNVHGTSGEISGIGRPHGRAFWEVIYNHYVNRLGLSAPWVSRMVERHRPEGISRGGGDQPAFGTLTFSSGSPSGDTPPSGLTARIIDGAVRLDWWGSAFAEHYDVQRSVSTCEGYRTVATLGADETRTYTDNPGDGTWYYRITASTAQETLVSHEVAMVTMPGELIFHLPLDEGSGTHAADATGRTGGATLKGSASWGAGHDGLPCLDLPGADDACVKLPPNLLKDVSDVTIAVWVRVPSTPPRNSWLFSFGHNDVSYFGCRANQRHDTWADSMRCEITKNTSDYTSGIIHSHRFHPQQWLGNPDGTFDSGASKVGQWVHIAMTLKGRLGLLYINGEATNSGEDMPMAPFQLDDTPQNWLGRATNGWDPLFRGRLQDFRIYNRALSATEISHLANG
ncbi:alginate lyase family protein [Marinobacter sp. 71-i]|uniref:Alginate lyase family protein n=1 Tax=Marinobacter iranensis TaxID=2962607 RepID=A0ABT5Y4Y1_9GAMM|nr:LamG-like jellyroll fold domain-containing protein [Marinobacter iranensis]MDF0748631.1 alginate lyase family protein [Marinobacter iranensis]